MYFIVPPPLQDYDPLKVRVLFLSVSPNYAQIVNSEQMLSSVSESVHLEKKPVFYRTRIWNFKDNMAREAFKVLHVETANVFRRFPVCVSSFTFDDWDQFT